jgi:hypothetical protein
MLLWLAGLSAVVAVSTVIGFNFFIFLTAATLLALSAIFLALDANARDAERVDLWGTNRLFDLQAKITLIDPKQLARLLPLPSLLQPTVSPSIANRISSPFPVRRKPLFGHQRSLSNGSSNPSLPVDLKNDVFTGHAKIDEQLRDLLGLLLRDYVYSWYSPLSHNHEFVNELRSFIAIVIRSLATRVESIDKVNFVTSKLVDQFVAHLRLFRMAEHQFEIQQLEGNNHIDSYLLTFVIGQTTANHNYFSLTVNRIVSRLGFRLFRP